MRENLLKKRAELEARLKEAGQVQPLWLTPADLREWKVRILMLETLLLLVEAELIRTA